MASSVAAKARFPTKTFFTRAIRRLSPELTPIYKQCFDREEMSLGEGDARKRRAGVPAGCSIIIEKDLGYTKR